MLREVAVSGASGKTGYRIAEELIKQDLKPRLVIRPESKLPPQLNACSSHRLNLFEPEALDQALMGVDALVIATGARPSVDLFAPMRVDAFGVKRQVESCLRVGVKRIILVSSLCAGRWIHPLNLFGLILVWKRIGEAALESSGLDWTVIRPGGLSEREDDLEDEGILWSGPDLQSSNAIPRRLVARSCLEALNTPSSIGRILEVTSNKEQASVPLSEIQW